MLGAMDGIEESKSKKEIEKETVVGNEEDSRTPVEAWMKQITLRGLVASVVIGSIFSIIAMKITLTIGITPHFNVSAALLAFIFIRTWTKALGKLGISSAPFTKQENTMIQTCSVACYSIALGGLFLLLFRLVPFFCEFFN